MPTGPALAARAGRGAAFPASGRGGGRARLHAGPPRSAGSFTPRHPNRTAARRGRGDAPLAAAGGERFGYLAAGLAAMIRVEAVWLSTTPLDLRAGMDTLLARVVQVFGEARPHQGSARSVRRQ